METSTYLFYTISQNNYNAKSQIVLTSKNFRLSQGKVMDVNYKLIQDTQVIIVFKYYKFIYTQIICFPPVFYINGTNVNFLTSLSVSLKSWMIKKIREKTIDNELYTYNASKEFNILLNKIKKFRRCQIESTNVQFKSTKGLYLSQRSRKRVYKILIISVSTSKLTLFAVRNNNK